MIVKVAFSHYFPFNYGITPKELKIESVRQIIKSKVGNMLSPASLLQRELTLVDVKIYTIHIRTTPKNTSPVYNKIKR
ncbi:hypothetical protein HZS_287 [Henneguya salminicola]|nr:hypothetical protein HZS_287 [Henneguya salminicola]